MQKFDTKLNRKSGRRKYFCDNPTSTRSKLFEQNRLIGSSLHSNLDIARSDEQGGQEFF